MSDSVHLNQLECSAATVCTKVLRAQPSAGSECAGCLQQECLSVLRDCLNVWPWDIGPAPEKGGGKAGSAALLCLVLKSFHPLRAARIFDSMVPTFTEPPLYARSAEGWGALSLGMSWSLDAPSTEPSPPQKSANDQSWLRPYSGLRMIRGCTRKPRGAGFQLLP